MTGIVLSAACGERIGRSCFKPDIRPIFERICSHEYGMVGPTDNLIE
jgi:hypothetical protein